MNGSHRLTLSCSLAVLILASGAARADDRETEAKSAYEAAYEESSKGDFAAALELYERSYSLFPRPRTMYNIALCEDALGRGEEAIGHFEEFMATAGERDSEYAPLAERRVEELKRQFYGQLLIKSRPNRAQVFLDGGATVEGKTPLRLLIRPGNHEVTVVATDRRPMSKSVQVAAGESVESYFDLEKSVLAIVASPPDATIEVQGSGGRWEALAEELSPGKYRVRVRAPGHRTAELEVKLPENTRLEQHVTLQPVASGSLVVTTSRAGASVSIDGRVVGVTHHAGDGPASLESPVRAGPHSVIVEQGAMSLMKTVHTAPGERVTLRVSAGRGTLHSDAVVWGLGGLGGAAVLTGGVLGVHSLVRAGRDDPSEHRAARSQALVSDVLVLVGGAALVGAWILNGDPDGELEVSRSLLAEDGDAL